MEKLNLIDGLLVLTGQQRITSNSYKEFETKLDDAIVKMYKLINDNYAGRI